MKKLLFSVAFFMLIMAGNLKAESYRASDYDSVDISTISFSSNTVIAFLGRGLVYGFGCSSSSVNSYFEIYDSSTAYDNGQPANANGVDGRRQRRFNYGNQYSTSAIASGDYWLQKPFKVTDGCIWFFSDKTANAAWLYYKDLTP